MRFACFCWVALVFLSVPQLFGASLASEKKAPRVTSVQGAMPCNYTIVDTVIMQNVAQRAAGQPAKPIVTRSVKGQIKRGQNVSTLIDVELSVPKKPISFEQVGELSQAATKIAGACDPRAGVITGAVSLVLDVGAEITGDVLTNIFGNDPMTLRLIEILPSQYYRIDESKGMVVVTEQFKTDLEKYTQLLDSYIGVVQRWNAVIAKYNADYRKWVDADPLQMDQAAIDRLSQQFDTIVKPVLKQKAEIELQLQNYALHRVSIMAMNTPAGKSCGANGAGSGPWRLYMYYFIGARQTNVFGIDFCVPSKTSTQDFLVQLVPNSTDAYGNFKPGGVKLVSSHTPAKITFPRQVAPGRFDYASRETGVFSWFDEMLIKEDAGDPTAYMLPFDIFAMRSEYEEVLRKRHDERSQERMGLLDQAIQLMTNTQGRREMRTSTSDRPVRTGRSLESYALEVKGPSNEVKEKFDAVFDKRKNLITTELGKTEPLAEMLGNLKNIEGPFQTIAKRLADSVQTVLDTQKDVYNGQVRGKGSQLDVAQIEAGLQTIFGLENDIKTQKGAAQRVTGGEKEQQEGLVAVADETLAVIAKMKEDLAELKK